MELFLKYIGGGGGGKKNFVKKTQENVTRLENAVRSRVCRITAKEVSMQLQSYNAFLVCLHVLKYIN